MMKEDISTFVNHLNEKLRQNGVVCLVEGKHDKEALEHIGIKGKIVTLQGHSFSEIYDLFFEYNTKTVVLMMDYDKEGKQMTKKLKNLLGHQLYIDETPRKLLSRITMGRIRHIEDLNHY